MNQIGQSQNATPDNELNEFLSDYLEYEICPFCSRSFFRGKLAYHLKHCNNQHPMLKNKSLSKPSKNINSLADNYEKCTNCRSRIPLYLIIKHKQYCPKPQQIKQNENTKTKDKNISEEKINPQSTFPRIRKYLSHDNKNKIMHKVLEKPFQTKNIRIRQQLRCFKIAEQVQKIQCEFCGRKFSVQASERHIPICSLLKLKERKEMSCMKDSKGSFHKRYKIKFFQLGKSQVMISKSFVIGQKLIKSNIQVEQNCPQKSGSVLKKVGVDY